VQLKTRTIKNHQTAHIHSAISAHLFDWHHPSVRSPQADLWDVMGCRGMSLDDQARILKLKPIV
jgi:hypothetical protein